MQPQLHHAFNEPWWMWQEPPIVRAMDKVHLQHLLRMLVGAKRKTAVATRLSQDIARVPGTVIRLLSGKKALAPADTLGFAVAKETEPGSFFPEKVAWLVGMVRDLCPEIGAMEAEAYVRYRTLLAPVTGHAPGRNADPELCWQTVLQIARALHPPQSDAVAVQKAILWTGGVLGQRLAEIRRTADGRRSGGR